MGFALVCKECGAEFEGRTMFVENCSARCRMRKYRRSEKGKLYVRSYNRENYKRPGTVKRCALCDEEFTTARRAQLLCGVCSASANGNAFRQRRHCSQLVVDRCSVCDSAAGVAEIEGVSLCEFHYGERLAIKNNEGWVGR